MADSTWTRRAGGLAARFGYLVLLTGCGALALYESLRIRRSYQTGEFLAGPGGYVMVIGVALLLFALGELAVQIRQGVRRRGSESPAPGVRAAADPGTEDLGRRGARRKMQLTFLLCALYVLLMKPLGFTLASVASLVANLLLLGNRVAVTAATAAVVFVVLRFGVPAIGLYLPRGWLGF